MVKSVVKERRNFLRAKRVLSLQYRLVSRQGKGNGNPWHLSMTEDMSVGGLTFYSDQELRVSDTLELIVAMSGVLDIYKGYAKVVRVERKKSAAFCFLAVKYLEDAPKNRRAKNYLLKKSKRI